MSVTGLAARPDRHEALPVPHRRRPALTAVPHWAISSGLVAGLLCCWQVLALVLADKGVLPTPTRVARQMWDDRGLYPANLWRTLGEAGLGWAWGVGLALLVAALVILVPQTERVATQVAITSYCIPIIAIGPVLNILMTGTGAMVALAALSVFFVTLTGALLGLRSSEPAALDVVKAYGGNRWVALRKVQLRYAVPSLFAGLKIAGPAALLGAMVGEYLGGDKGLGVAMISAERTFNVPRTWGLAVLASGLGCLIYVFTAVVGNRLGSWVAQTSPAPHRPTQRQGTSSNPLTRMLLSTAGAAASVAVALVGWQAAVAYGGVDRFIAKGPADIWAFLVTDPVAADNRAQLGSAMATTGRHAAAGFIAGALVGLLVALVFVMTPTVRRATLPMAIALQSVPLVAMTPLIGLTFGRGAVGVCVIGGLVTFFPTLVNVSTGLVRVPAGSLDLMQTLGASPWRVVRTVRIPSALPSIFASLKIAAPGALFGAVVAEWLITGDGLGFYMLQAGTSARFTAVWAATAVLVAVSAALYAVIGAVERLIQERSSL